MEIKDLLSCYIDRDTNIMEVSFRLNEDNEDLIRVDNIDFDLAKSYGYTITNEDYGFLDSELIENGFGGKEKDNELDNNELINFLNEYYTLNPNNIPDSQIY